MHGCHGGSTVVKDTAAFVDAIAQIVTTNYTIQSKAVIQV